MNRQVVVQLSTDETPPRVGELVSNRGVWAKVRWVPNGDVEEVRLGGKTQLVNEGSLRHDMLLNPERVKQRLAERPTEIFVRQLREASRPLNATDLKDALEQMGLDAPDVAVAWTTARKTLMSHPGITKSGQHPPRYGWAADRASGGEPSASLDIPSRPDQVPTQVPTAASTTVDAVESPGDSQGHVVGAPSSAVNEVAEGNADDTRPVANGASSVATTEPVEETAEGRSGDKHGFALGDPGPNLHATVEDVRSLIDLAAADKLVEQELDRLQELISDWNVAPLVRVIHACIIKATPDKNAVRTLAVTPLATAKALSGFSEAACMAVAKAAQLDESHELGLLICCLPKFTSIDKADVPAAITAVGVRRLVAGILIELDRMTRAARADAYLGVSSAVRRIAASSIVDQVETSYLVRLLRCLDLVSRPRPAAEEPATAVVEAVANRLRLSVAGSSRLDDDELSILAKAASLLPFARSGGRSGLLAALVRDHADDLASPRWWRGLSPEDLVVAGNGALGHVLTLEAVSQEVVAPLALETVRSAKSRRDLAWVLSVPATVADTVPVDVAAKAATAVAATDGWLASWLDHLRDAQGRKRLEAEADRAGILHVRAETARVAAQSALQEMEDRNDRLQVAVSDSHQATNELHSARERQIKIDAVRAMAQLGALVVGSAGRLTDEQLVARVESSLARQSLIPIGSRGSQVLFDPSVHDSSDPGLNPGEQVTVTRSGYTWETDQEAIVLVKAVVDRAVGHESG